MTSPFHKCGVAFVLIAMLAACHGARNAPPSNSPSPRPSSTPGLPFAGRTILPGHRIVAFYGAAQTPAMGILGHGSPDRIAGQLVAQARAYDGYGEPAVPAFELIATMAQGSAGAEGRYSAPTDDATIERYLSAVRAIHGLLILDIQPGRSPFLREVRRYERFWREPDVSLALDSEWSMGPNEVPAQVIGGTTGAVVNSVSAYLAAIIKRNNLPQKMLIVHQFTPDMIAHRNAIVQRPGIAIVYHVDGFGTRAGKLSKYRFLAQGRNAAFMGFKLFYQQDINMFSASEVMRLLTPRPNLITYQ